MGAREARKAQAEYYNRMYRLSKEQREQELSVRDITELGREMIHEYRLAPESNYEKTCRLLSHGLRQKEIAVRLGITPTRANQLANRARKRGETWWRGY